MGFEARLAGDNRDTVHSCSSAPPPARKNRFVTGNIQRVARLKFLRKYLRAMCSAGGRLHLRATVYDQYVPICCVQRLRSRGTRAAGNVPPTSGSLHSGGAERPGPSLSRPAGSVPAAERMWAPRGWPAPAPPLAAAPPALPAITSGDWKNSSGCR